MVMLAVRISASIAFGLLTAAACSSAGDATPPSTGGDGGSGEGGASSSSGGDSGPAEGGSVVPASASTQLTPGMSGEAALEDGAKITIPNWAIPPTAAAMEFRVQRTTATPPVPGGQTAASAVYDFSPSNITFALPVKLTLPLTGTGAPERLRVYRVDPTTNTPNLVSAEVSADGKTASVLTYHLSSWFGSWTTEGGTSEKAAGALKVTNNTATNWLGVCATSQVLTYPDPGNVFPSEPIAVAPNGTIGWSSTQLWHLPQGTYNFCIESSKAGSILSPPGKPSHIQVPDVKISAPWSSSNPKTTDLSFGELPSAIDGPCNCTPQPTVLGMVYTNTNVGGVFNKPTAPTVFTTTECNKVSRLATYHWNNGKGKTPGTITLSKNGTNVFAPLQAAGTPGQGGVKDANWNVYPDTILPPGTYTVVDSDPDTWSQNSETGGSGMVWVEGVKAACP